MKLTFLYSSVTDLDEAVAFHRDGLGLEEAWRMEDDSVAFSLPDDEVQLMVGTDGQPSGPMYLVDDADAWVRDHPAVAVAVPRYEIPGGAVIGLEGPGGNVFYVFDQPDA